jgi:hypothetical protein
MSAPAGQLGNSSAVLAADSGSDSSVTAEHGLNPFEWFPDASSTGGSGSSGSSGISDSSTVEAAVGVVVVAAVVTAAVARQVVVIVAAVAVPEWRWWEQQ